MRRIVVCADGTWNTPDDISDGGVPTPTNVVKMFKAIAHEGNGIEQRGHYEPGVGTAHNLMDKWFGGGIGRGIDRHILNCYEYLVKEYRLGDEIYLFGFSRGAYTVRSLAGLIRNAGLLRPEHIGYVQHAYDLYRDRDEDASPDGDAAKAFRREHSYTEYKEGDSTPIECIGCWDTVGALGVPLGVFRSFNAAKYGFHDTQLSSRVKNAFHALAINEKRGPFEPTLWYQPKKDADAKRNWLEQAWFVGVHSNVGGGCADSGLSDTALLWMKDRVSKRTGLQFDGPYLEQNVRSDFLGGVLEDSFQGIYEAMPPYQRAIDDLGARAPATHTWEYVHRSARARYDRMMEAKEIWGAPKFTDYVARPDARFLDSLDEAGEQEYTA